MSKGFGGIYVTPMQDRKRETVGMIKEKYCNYDLAIELRNVGLDGDYHAYYCIFDKKITRQRGEAPHLYIPAPTIAMAIDWLAEVHKIVIHASVPWYFHDKFYAVIQDVRGDVIKQHETKRFDTKEAALEMAIEYSLKELINNDTR